MAVSFKQLMRNFTVRRFSRQVGVSRAFSAGERRLWTAAATASCLHRQAMECQKAWPRRPGDAAFERPSDAAGMSAFSFRIKVALASGLTWRFNAEGSQPERVSLSSPLATTSSMAFSKSNNSAEDRRSAELILTIQHNHQSNSC